jgi:hypothetical protein
MANQAVVAGAFSKAQPTPSRNVQTVAKQLTDNGPKTVLLSDMVGTGSERLFSADGETSSVHQVAKELPACTDGRRTGFSTDSTGSRPCYDSPVGTSNTSKPFSLATKSMAPLVGMLLARPLMPPLALLK